MVDNVVYQIKNRGRNNMKKVLLLLVVFMLTLSMAGCTTGEVADNIDKEGEGTKQDVDNQFATQDRLSTNQPTPTEFEYSIERHNLLKRAYWVNGMRDVANSMVYPGGDLPLGFIKLTYLGGEIEGIYLVEGKVSSLNSYLTKDENCELWVDYYNNGGVTSQMICRTLADVDGSYGENDAGIFFFDTYGVYHEWSEGYHYMDYVPWNVVNNLPLLAINRVDLGLIREDGTIVQPGEGE